MPFVQANSTFIGGGTSGACTFPSPVTAGNAIFCFAFDGGGINQTVTFTDDLNTGTVSADCASNITPDNDTLAILSRLNSNAGSGGAHGTITCHGTNLAGFIIGEWSGLLTSAAFDKTASATGTGTAASSGNTAVLSQANEVVIALCGVSNSGNAATATGGKTLRFSDSNSHIFIEDLVVSSTAAQSGDFGIVSDNWGVLVATYKLVTVTPNLMGQAIL